jgi:phosphoribosylformylglycinamidine cyclo-ligase
MTLTYKKSGVDINAGEALVEFLQKKNPAIGGFSGLYPILGGKYHLVASTDGVGTKLKLAFMFNEHETIGIDLVAMCVNDLIACGATPLFFLDYYATGKLDLKTSKKIMSGIINGCKLGKMTLLGGETAEMPGMYSKGEYDLAGFSVGMVEKKDVIDGSKIKPGDVLIGLPSSGFHSNGYSLVRRAFSKSEMKKYKKELLAPTKIYVSEVEKLKKELKKHGQKILGIAHITGGGLVDNVPRFLPKNCKAIISKGSWKIPHVIGELCKKKTVSEKELYHVFNMGIGLVVAVKKKALKVALKALPQAKVIGRIEKGKPQVVFENG